MPPRPITSYAKIQRLIAALRRNRRWQLAGIQRQGLRRLNAGCGPKAAAGFINLDWDWRPGVNLCWDLTRELPFADGFLDGVYSEHCLEHFDPAMASHVLRELCRCMRQGAVIRIIVPDAAIYLAAYEQSHRGPASFPYVDPARLASAEITPLMAVNQMIFFHGHRYMYDYATLRHFLLEAGFTQVSRKSFGAGTPQLLLDSPDRECESLYVEAIK